MPIVKYLQASLLLFVLPDALIFLFPFLAGNTAWPAADKLPSGPHHAVRTVIVLVSLGVVGLLQWYYRPWFEVFLQNQNQDQPIGASQPEVDLEAQLKSLNFPPMPDMFDIIHNPWALP